MTEKTHEVVEILKKIGPSLRAELMLMWSGFPPATKQRMQREFPSLDFSFLPEDLVSQQPQEADAKNNAR